MSNLRKFVEDFSFEAGEDAVRKGMDIMNEYRVYPGSINITEECTCFIAWEGENKVLVVVDGKEKDRFEGRDENINGRKVKICPLNTANSRIIRRIFDFTNPTANKKYDMSIGLGDRLGLASPGHIRLVMDKKIFPVLAQQSVRELNLTNRTFEDVLSSAVWAVLQEGYREGYGADGDHLKTAEEVKQALYYDYTMITLDCSEHINKSIEDLPEESLRRQYAGLDEKVRLYWEDKYSNRAFDLGAGMNIHISEATLIKTVLMYKEALSFIEDIYHTVIKDCDRDVDFEISIDETSCPTSPEIHYVIASEIKGRGVRFMSLAPRFCGEFQKGIDYKGDIDQFRRELKYHAAIAEYFDYKISIHSGSDKFSVFPAIGELTGHRFHLKTAGTNWLEAVGVIAKVDPKLFLSMYRFTLDRLDDAKKYYNISTERHMVPEIICIAENPLNYVCSDEAVRQVLHVTYGYILCETDKDGKYVFKDKFYNTINENENLYYEALYKHISRHLISLGIGVNRATKE